jgi:hypothetical protein
MYRFAFTQKTLFLHHQLGKGVLPCLKQQLPRNSTKSLTKKMPQTPSNIAPTAQIARKAAIFRLALTREIAPTP